jgi:hypothetical protein
MLVEKLYELDGFEFNLNNIISKFSDEEFLESVYGI